MKDNIKCDYYQQEVSWDDKMMGTDIIFHQISGEKCAKDKVSWDLDEIINIRRKSPNGLSWVYPWGSARYAANLAFFTAVAMRHSYCDEYKCWEFLKEQINYILGDGTGQGYKREKKI